MYNRYIRGSDGEFTRIPQREPVRKPPDPSEQNAPPPPKSDSAGQAPPPRQASCSGGNWKFLDRHLEKLHLGDLDSADLMLLALLFFLFEEKADDELLIALGLLLIL